MAAYTMVAENFETGDIRVAGRADTIIELRRSHAASGLVWSDIGGGWLGAERGDEEWVILPTDRAEALMMACEVGR
jgi:hypothetical protein